VDAGDAVSLMTIHAAKGLEWPIVFIPNLCAAKRSDSSPVLFDAEVGVAFKLTMQTRDGKLGKVEPNLLKLIRKRRSRLDSAESARILYVAITRGRDRVYLSAAGGNRNDLDILRSRLDSAGIGIETTPEVERRFVTGTTGLLLADPKKIEVQVNEVVNQVSRVPMSGLGDYAACPKQFRLRHLDGHPGLPDGGDAGRVTGMLTHLALELDLATAEALRPLADGAADELTIEAARLASVFNRSKSFSEFRIENSLREVPVNFEFGGIELSGKADLVGSDWVLDFKTDSEMDPDRHLLQLWAYARGLSKRRAVVAYLRHERVHEFCSDDMAMAEPLAEEVVNGIRSGRFDPTPSVTTCAKCEYAVICDEAIKAPVRYVSQGVQ
jgi:ATP-dependent helicase/nuclease subunit A